MERILRATPNILACLITSFLLAGCTSGDPVETNDPPNVPTNPYPANGATFVNRILTLSWDCSDPDGDALTFKVMLYNGSDLVGYGSGLTNEYWEIPDTLDPAAGYGWQVTATEQTEARQQSVGGYWTFTTGSLAHSPPDPPSNPVPHDFALDQPIDVDLSWTCSDPDPGDTLTYDVFFGTTGVIPLVSAGQKETTYDPGTLDYDKTYLWDVVAHDLYGNSTSGPGWRFTTEAQPGGEGVYAVLTACRNIMVIDPAILRVDRLTARFDSAYAPVDPIIPLQPSGVECSSFILSWDDGANMFTYQQAGPADFLVLNGEYIYNVEVGGGVPTLSKMFITPSCEPYVTSPCAFCEVPVTGFTATWEGSACHGQVRLVILDANGDSTGVDVVTINDGSYAFTQQELTVINDLVSEYALILIYENRNDISATGYDPRSYVTSKIMNPTPLYFNNP